MADQAYEPRLKTEYRQRIRAAMKERFGYTNEMQIPKLDKIVINMGVGEAVADSKKINSALGDLAKIAGQKPVPTKAWHTSPCLPLAPKTGAALQTRCLPSWGCLCSTSKKKWVP